MSRIYNVTLKRILTWNLRVRADSEKEADTIAEELACTFEPGDNTGYDITIKASKDQTVEADND